MTLALVLAFVVGMGSGAALGRVKLRRGPINVVRGILLPHPSDERWKLQDARFNCGNYKHDYHNVYTIGDVQVVEDCTVQVEKLPVPGSARYRDAVIRARMERKALAAALGDS